MSTLNVTQRGTICNMIMETGATTGLFPSDAQTHRWLVQQGREADWVALAADPGAAYDEAEVIDLPALEPLIATPSSPGNVVPVRDVAGLPVGQVCVGSSVNSGYEDLALVGATLRDKVADRRLILTVTPGSRQIQEAILRSGTYLDLVGAGARMLEPVRGPCIGIGQAPGSGIVSVRTFNRNFPGRSGTDDDQVYLCSPATAAATALRGVIADPRDLGAEPPLPPVPPPNPEADDRHFVFPPPIERAGDPRRRRPDPPAAQRPWSELVPFGNLSRRDVPDKLCGTRRRSMLTEYVRGAMHQARYEILADDGSIYGEIPGFDGVYANATTLEACRDELQEVLEEWMLLRISRNLPLPTVEGRALTIQKAG